MSAEPIVQIQKVVKTYKLGETEVQALRGVELTLYKGEFTALIGASGSGKSTLLNLIGCLDEPDQGAVLIESRDVAKMTEHERSQLRNRRVGFIFQSFNLIPVLSVYENIELPLIVQQELTIEERKKRVEQALEDVGLQKFRDYLPNKLSGGQRQRVAIARALVTQPALILADEPTANLDSDTAHKIIDLLLEINHRRQVTFFFCTHDEKLMGRVGRTVRISDGKIETL